MVNVPSNDIGHFGPNGLTVCHFVQFHNMVSDFLGIQNGLGFDTKGSGTKTEHQDGFFLITYPIFQTSTNSGLVVITGQRLNKSLLSLIEG